MKVKEREREGNIERKKLTKKKEKRKARKGEGRLREDE